MAELAVAMTYGEALFGAAKDINKIQEVSEDTAALVEIFEAEPDFFKFLCSPGIPALEKKQVLKEVFGDKCVPEFLNFLYILIDKCRITAFKEIAKIYKDLMSREEGVSYGKIVSVKPLSEQQLASFEAETGKLLKEKVKLENETDPGLIGGVVVYIEGKIIDASVKSRLQTLAGSIM